MRRGESRQTFSRSGILSSPRRYCAMACLASPSTAVLPAGGVEHAFEIAPQFQTPRAALVFVFLALSAQRDVVVAGVEVAAAFEERAPLARDVRKVVAFTVAAGDPFGHFGGVVGRGHPVATRRVEPEHLSAVPGRHHGRNGPPGRRDGAAVPGRAATASPRASGRSGGRRRDLCGLRSVRRSGWWCNPPSASPITPWVEGMAPVVSVASETGVVVCK